MFWNVRATPARVTRSGRLAGDVLAVEDDPAGGRPVEAGQAVEERRLAGAVGPDQRDDRLRRHAEGDVVDRDEAAEDLRDVGGLEQHVAARLGRHGALGPLGPAGRLAHRSRAPRSAGARPRGPEATRRPRLSSLCSSILRLDDGMKPSGRSTIIASRKKPKMPKLIDGHVEVQAELVGDAVELLEPVAVEHRQRDRAEDDAPDVAHAADDDHREDEDREAELELVDVHGVVVGPEEHARRSRRATRRSRRPTASCAPG